MEKLESQGQSNPDMNRPTLKSLREAWQNSALEQELLQDITSAGQVAYTEKGTKRLTIRYHSGRESPILLLDEQLAKDPATKALLQKLDKSIYVVELTQDDLENLARADQNYEKLKTATSPYISSRGNLSSLQTVLAESFRIFLNQAKGMTNLARLRLSALPPDLTPDFFPDSADLFKSLHLKEAERLYTMLESGMIYPPENDDAAKWNEGRGKHLKGLIMAHVGKAHNLHNAHIGQDSLAAQYFPDLAEKFNKACVQEARAIYEQTLQQGETQLTVRGREVSAQGEIKELLGFAKLTTEEVFPDFGQVLTEASKQKAQRLYEEFQIAAKEQFTPRVQGLYEQIYAVLYDGRNPEISMEKLYPDLQQEVSALEMRSAQALLEELKKGRVYLDENDPTLSIAGMINSKIRKIRAEDFVGHPDQIELETALDFVKTNLPAIEKAAHLGYAEELCHKLADEPLRDDDSSTPDRRIRMVNQVHTLLGYVDAENILLRHKLDPYTGLRPGK